ncbi:MAG: 4'-phosphopantetheinyl transferase superfamily protein [Eubacterium sp.]
MIRVYTMDISMLKRPINKIKVALLLNKVLLKEGFNGSFKIEKNTWGKPFLTDYPFIHFNGSHSGKYLVLALSDYPVGIDIQEKTGQKNGIELAHRFMALEDYEALKKMSDPDNQFYECWAQKESYMKYRGLGFSLPMTDFYICQNENKVYENGQFKENVFFSTLKFDAEYALWVCGEESEAVIVDRL